MSQDIEIDPDSRTITYYEKPDAESVRDFIESGGKVLSRTDAITLLNEIDRLRKDCDHHKQAALDISDENDRLEQDIADQAEGAAIWDQVEAILDGFTVDPPRPGAKRVKDLLTEIDRLRKLVPPETERGPGFVGQGSWSVYAEKVVEERDAAREGLKQLLAEKIELRDELSGLCEEIRCLKEENDELKEVSGILNREILKENSELHRINSGLQEEVTRCGAALSSKKEHANVHYGHDEFLGVDGYGTFSLKRVYKDYWEFRLLNERVALYNRKGRRVRGQVIDRNNHEPD